MNFHWYNLNTLHAGTGKVDFIQLQNINDLESCLEQCNAQQKKVCIIGAGTNLVGSDEDYCCTAIRLPATLDVQLLENGRCLCSTGVLGRRLFCFMAEQGWGGAAPISGIPGTIGGMLKMNAGALGMEICSLVQAMNGIDLHTGAKWHWEKGQGGWGYRQSPVPANICLISAQLQFSPCNPVEELAALTSELQRRQQCTPSWWSAGSVFRNPSAERPAGKVLEEAGCKGLEDGPFQISPRHANWIINAKRMPGSAASVQRLLDEMQRRAAIPLHCEIKMV